MLTLEPRNDKSLGVYLIAFAVGTYQVSFDHEYAIPDEDAQSSADVDFFLDLASAGSVRMLARGRRAKWQIFDGVGWRAAGNYAHLQSLFVLPRKMSSSLRHVSLRGLYEGLL